MEITKKSQTVHKTLRGAALALAAMTGLSTAAAADQPAFTMATIIDAAYGSEVQAGKYEVAIDRLADSAGLEDRFSDNTNLCVAYTKLGNTADALIACDRAVVLATEMTFDRRKGVPRQAQERERSRYLGLALTNLGVLHAVKGQRTAAYEYFNEAIRVGRFTKVAKVNLARLGDVETETA